jgi:hypothetical protein
VLYGLATDAGECGLATVAGAAGAVIGFMATWAAAPPVGAACCSAAERASASFSELTGGFAAL